MAHTEQEEKGTSGLFSRFNIHFEREGLAGHIGLLLLAVALVIIIAVTLMTTTMSKRISRAELFNDGVSLTKASAISLSKVMDAGDTSQITGILRVIAARNKVNYCMVLDKDGRIVASSSEKLVGTVFNNPVLEDVQKSIGLFSYDYVDGAGREVRDFYYPINGKSDWLGTLRLGIAYDFPVISWSNKHYAQVLGATALFVFIVLSLVYYVVRLLFRPLSSIRSQLEQLLTNREVKAIKLDKGGEFKDMADKWNALLNIVSDNHKEIEKLNADLEISNRLFLFEKRRNEVILDNVQSGLICVSGTGSVICVNRAAGNLLRFPVENLLDQDIQKIISIPQLSEFINANLADEKNVTSRFAEISTNGSRESTMLRVSFSPLMDEGGKSIGSLITMRDVTQQKMAERATEEFVLHVSHELKQPLSSIRLYVESLMDQDVEDPEERAEFFNTVIGETERLTDLIENLVNISKMEAGSITTKPSPVKLKRLIRDSVAAFNAQATKKNIEVDLELPEKLASFSLDKVLIENVVNNLVGNALKYTPDGGTVRVALEEVEDDLVLHVEDSGIGISEEELPKIFDKFYRTSNPEVLRQSGSGIGLSSARQIIKLHGGNINVTSTPGEGSHFTVTFPKH